MRVFDYAPLCSINIVKYALIIVRVCRGFECIYIRGQIWHKQPVRHNIQGIMRYRADGRQYLPCLLAIYSYQFGGAIHCMCTAIPSGCIITPQCSLCVCAVFDGRCGCSVFVCSGNGCSCTGFRYDYRWRETICPISSIRSIHAIFSGCSSITFFTFFTLDALQALFSSIAFLALQA